MRTVRNSSCLLGGGVPALEGGLLPGGACLGGCLLLGGGLPALEGSAPGGGLLQGVPAPGGGIPALRQTPRGQTDR